MTRRVGKHSTGLYHACPYDATGNRPSSASDRLRLEYDGNRLTSVTDSVTTGHSYANAFHFADGASQSVEYEYDDNGNMTKDLNRGISDITYNSLNLPSVISFGDGSYIEYTYTSDGAKLRTKYGVQPGIGPLTPSGTGNTGSGGSGTASPESQTSLPSLDELSRIDYCGNVVYDRGERRLILGNGYVTFDAATETPSYHFYLRDHLGNNRVVIARDGTVEQVTHYYPFGGLMRESTNPAVQPYKYGGKELDRTSGLDAYDFGARTYFADRLQWSTMDPLCEKYYDWSPYVYCGGNPINYTDHHGDVRTDFLDETQGKSQFVNDGINQVLEISHDIFQRLYEFGFDPNSSVYHEAIANGLLRRDLFYTIENVLTKSTFIKFDKEKSCLDLATMQNNVSIEGPSKRIDMLDVHQNGINFITGVDYLKSELAKNHSIVVGVFTDHNHGNHNPNTGHFLNIVGMGFDSKGNYFSYYDNATSHINIGTDLNANRFYVGMKNGTSHVLYDADRVIVGNVWQYIVSEIRKNK